MTEKTQYTKGQHLLYGSTFALWLSSPIMAVAGIWHDPRWFGTALLAVIVGFVLGWLAGEVGK